MTDDMNMRDMIEVPDGIYRIMSSLVRLVNHTGLSKVIKLSAALRITPDGWPTREEFLVLIRWMYGTKSKDKEEEANV